MFFKPVIVKLSVDSSEPKPVRVDSFVSVYRQVSSLPVPQDGP